jgi:hypothetical protein
MTRRTNPTKKGTEEATSEEWVAKRGAHRTDLNSLVLLQVNCRSILNKSLDFWNSIDTYNPDAMISTETWLRDEISDAEVFQDNKRTYRRDRNTQGGGMFFT